MKKFISIIFISIFILSSCTTQEQNTQTITSNTLNNSSWEFEKFPATLQFWENRYSVDLWCNAISGAYTLKNNTIAFQSSMSTMMACGEDIMNNEQTFTQLLQTIDSIKIVDETLILSNQTQSYTFTPTQHEGLTWEWKLQTLWMQNALVSDVVFADSIINFDQDGKVSWTTPCNNFMGSYQIENNSISFWALASTKKLCDKQANTYEQKIIETLAGSNQYSIEKNILTIQNPETQNKIIYVK